MHPKNRKTPKNASHLQRWNPCACDFFLHDSKKKKNPPPLKKKNDKHIDIYIYMEFPTLHIHFFIVFFRKGSNQLLDPKNAPKEELLREPRSQKLVKCAYDALKAQRSRFLKKKKKRGKTTVLTCSSLEKTGVLLVLSRKRPWFSYVFCLEVVVL